MGAWNPADLAALRSEMQTLNPDSWSLVKREIVTTDTGSGDVWTVAASGWAEDGTGARLMPAGLRATEQIRQARPGSPTAFVLTLPAGTPISADDRVIYGSRLEPGDPVPTWETTDASGNQTPIYPRVLEVVGTTTGQSFEIAARANVVEV